MTAVMESSCRVCLCNVVDAYGRDYLIISQLRALMQGAEGGVTTNIKMNIIDRGGLDGRDDG